ncbi:hypothetical protein PUN28_019370 [Cardiocondyla obscurior]|uniref:Ima1 N-terminal domain-containing protein n=1 Tax=Cardiocondyla obscurior TaxID=286306 RepID=A0AAW2ECI5_9HYME
MDPDHSAFAFDCVAASAPVLLIFAACLTIFYRLRARWPVKVNCWFCNENTKIWRQHLNWWLCPWCEQYNGFSKDGDYLCDIPEQYATSRVCAKYCKLSKDNDNHVFKGKLCIYCNKRESLKLSELSNFEPKSEKLYDSELKTFKEYLEIRYPLCDNCKLTVQDVLHRQSVWLTRYRMLFFRHKSIKTLVDNARKLEMIFRAVSMSLVSIMIYSHDFIWLPIVGLFFHLCACWASSTNNRKSNILLTFLWFCIIFLMFAKSSIFENTWLTIEHITQHHMIMVCACIITVVTLKSSAYKNTLIGSVAFKKIKLHSRNTAPTSLQFTCNNQSGDNIVPSEINDHIKSSVYANKLSSTEIKFNKSHSAILRQKLSTITANGGNNEYITAASQSENSPPDSCLNESLSTLLLGENLPKISRITKITPAIFERRIYSTTSSENLFKKSNSVYSKRRCILSPPKLRSVTQASWVAGGYWQEGMISAMPSTLSRSSSQSSGFGSVGSSNLASSREPSVLEFDRCSVVSEATRWSCQTPRPGQVDSPISRPQSRYSDVTGSHLQNAVQTHHPDTYQVQESIKPNIENRNGSVPTYADRHTTTVVASPGWLSALLCGSLILNMIVLCTTLLR